MHYLDYGEEIMNIYIYIYYAHIPQIVYIKCVLFFKYLLYLDKAVR